MSKTSKMTICLVHEVLEENKTSTSPWSLTLHGPLAKLSTVVSNEIKCGIIQFIFYTAAGVKTYKELYVSPVLGLSLACRMQRNCLNDVQSCNR